MVEHHEIDIVLRHVNLTDAEVLFAWRNDPDTRSASRNTGAVELSEHRAWLKSVLASSERIIRIGELSGMPVGVVRAESTADGWELSWTVAPDARGRGIGRRMLVKFRNELKGRVVATIRPGHTASARIAAAAGLVRIGVTEDGGFERWAAGP